MKRIYQLISSLLLLIISFSAIAQENSPWKNFVNQTVSGVLAAPGCHEYSLTGGQGYSVYLRNDNTQPVTVTGLLTAKTVCGNIVSTRFNVTLGAGEIASGSDYDKATQNGQTGVVTALNCVGVKYPKMPKYTNRISNVVVSDMRVMPVAGGAMTKPSVATIIKETAKPTVVLPKFDSLGFYKSQWSYTKDSLLNELNLLKYKNRALQDTINYKTVIYNNLLNAQLNSGKKKKKK